MGFMQFDTADLRHMENEGTLVDVITHEMGHVLGIGTHTLAGERTDPKPRLSLRQLCRSIRHEGTQ